ncbi:MAG: hypothetical protein KDB18_05545 [Salinibacterium sp.]|nr:hypothetical protein [Salinibacterium sp.]
MPLSLDVLDHVSVASPCPMNWDEMTGDDRVRHCEMCELNVYNIAGMTRQDATELITQTEGRVCIRLHRRADGTVITRDCPVGLAAVRRASRRVWVAVAAGVALACTAVTHAWARVKSGGNLSPWGSSTYVESLAQTRAYARFSQAVLDPSATTGRVMMGAIACPTPSVPSQPSTSSGH